MPEMLDPSTDRSLGANEVPQANLFLRISRSLAYTVLLLLLELREGRYEGASEGS